MDKLPNALAYEYGKVNRKFSDKNKINPVKKSFESNSHENKEQYINELKESLPTLKNIDNDVLKHFLNDVNTMVNLYKSIEEKREKLNLINTNIEKSLEIFKNDKEFKSLINEADKLDKQQPFFMRLDTAFKNSNQAFTPEFSEKFGDLVHQMERQYKIKDKIDEIDNARKNYMRGLEAKYPELRNHVDYIINNLIQKKSDIKASASTSNPEIETNPPVSELKQENQQLNTQIEKLKQENQQLKDKIEKLTALVQELSDQIKELQKSKTQTEKTSDPKSSSGFFKKLENILNKIKGWLKKTFAKNDKQLGVPERQNDQPTKFGKVKKVFKGIGKFLRNVAKYTGLLRFARTFPYRYRHNSTWGKIGKGTLEVLGGIVLAGGVYMVPFYIYKTAKYNHKDVMHQKYSEDGGGDINGKGGKEYYKNNAPNPDHVLIYRKEGQPERAFFIRPDAKDRELAFLTRHPISNKEKQEMYNENKQNHEAAKNDGKQKYKAAKNEISKLTKAQVKELRNRNSSETNDNSSKPDGWSVISYEEYKNLNQSKDSGSPNQKEGEN